MSKLLLRGSKYSQDTLYQTELCQVLGDKTCRQEWPYHHVFT